MNCNYFNCKRHLNSRQEYIDHLIVHSNDLHFRVRCPFCPTFFDSYAIFKKHANKNHILSKNIDVRKIKIKPEIYICNRPMCES